MAGINASFFSLLALSIFLLYTSTALRSLITKPLPEYSHVFVRWRERIIFSCASVLGTGGCCDSGDDDDDTDADHQ